MRMAWFQLILLSLLTAHLNGHLQAEDKPVQAVIQPEPMLKAEGPIVIDGVLDEPSWKNATAIRADYINSKKGVLSPEPHLTVKYTWDEHYLYIGYETFDKNLTTKSKGNKKGPENNKREGCEIWVGGAKKQVDVVEFFISFGDEHFFWEFHHNASNQFNDVWINALDPNWPISKSSLSNWGLVFNNQEFVNDEGEFTTVMAVKLKPKADGTPSTVNDPSDEDTGYTAELRFPWAGLGAPVAARGDPKKNETGWKMQNQQILLLAVVQDGDLPERYHHSSPLRSGDWFHKTVPLWPKYIFSTTGTPIEKPEQKLPEKPADKKSSFFDVHHCTSHELAAEIFRRIDQNEPFGDLFQPAADHGMVMAQEMVQGLNPDKPQRTAAIHDFLNTIARCRGTHKDVLKMYDPVAYEIFYTEAGLTDEKKFAQYLNAPDWPRLACDVFVNAAPRPTLEWLNAQARSTTPEIAKLSQVWSKWGSDILLRRERQHADAVRAVIAAFTENEKIIHDPATLLALIRFAGETGAAGVSEFILRQLKHADAAVRAEACDALGHFVTAQAPPALLELAESENDVRVLTHWAESLSEWPEDVKAGAAALNLFARSKAPEVRRALLFSSIKATWPQRQELLLKAFQEPEQGVLGIALQAISMRAEAPVIDKTVGLISSYDDPPAALIDALGSVKDPRSAPYLIEALKKVSNPSIRIKLILALEKIDSPEAEAALLEQLKRTTDPVYAEQLAGIAGRIQIKDADEILTALAEDLSAPLPLRVQCVWAMGSYRTERVRASLNRMDAAVEQFFGLSDTAAKDVSSWEKTQQARLLIKMARLQQGDSQVTGEVAALYAQGSPTTKFSLLMLLSRIKMDHPVILDGLHSPDFAIVLAAVYAAKEADPKKYHEALTTLAHAPYVKALLETGLDLNGFPFVLNQAIAAGKERAP